MGDAWKSTLVAETITETAPQNKKSTRNRRTPTELLQLGFRYLA